MSVGPIDADDYRGLGWGHGALTVQRLGAMMAPVTFLLADGRQISPLHIAPWAGEPNAKNLPGILRRLRGDWPCAPFGYSVQSEGWPADWVAAMGSAEPEEEVHGYCSNHNWQWQDAPGGSLRMSIDYPAASPIERIERSVTPDPNAAAVDLEFRIVVRRRCRMPIGLHPVFRLPKLVGAARLELGRFDCARTYPGTVEPSAPMFAMNRIFHDLAAVPGRDGGTVDASRLPFAADTEELLQIEGLDGSVALANDAEGYRVRLTWQTEHFPSLLLWISNRGRKFEPWNGRHLALGMEPVCSPFGLGAATATADNPIAKSGVPTALEFSPDKVFVTRYRIEAQSL
jgi:hypothetical protein